MNHSILWVGSKEYHPECAPVESVDSRYTALKLKAKKLLSCLPRVSCDDFHHSSKECHEYGDACLPMAKYLVAVDDLEAELNRTT